MERSMQVYLDMLEGLGGISLDGDKICFEEEFLPPLALDVDDRLGMLTVDHVPYGVESSPKQVWANIMAAGLSKGGLMAYVDYASNGSPNLKVFCGSKSKGIPNTWEAVQSVYNSFTPDAELVKKIGGLEWWERRQGILSGKAGLVSESEGVEVELF